MRQFKFRAWDGEEMFDIARFDFADNTIYRHLFACDGKLGENCRIMQYTGLKDKNGKEIYEGDIVRVNHDDGYETVGQVEWGLSSKWFGTYPAFAIAELESEMNSFAEIYDTGQYTIEVIGNIFEDKHLLKEESK